MSVRKDSGFDRVRPRQVDPDADPRLVSDAQTDQQGKRALFSAAEQPAAFGSVTIDCSSCGERSVVGARQAVMLAIPSLHLPLLRAAPWSWMRCPACNRRTWVNLAVRL